MYVYITLGEVEGAREIGSDLLKKQETREVLNGLSIIEEKSGNYDKAIEYIDKILEKEPNNQALKKKKERIQHIKERKTENNEKSRIYKKIATLERNIKKAIDEKQADIIKKGGNVNKAQIINKIYFITYHQIKQLAEQILAEYPEEIVAREKLIKSLYIIGDKERAEQEAENFLKTNSKDEIALWYLSKICKDNGNIHREKECLEQIVENSKPNVNIKAQQWLERVNNILKSREEQEKFHKEIQQSYTEEDRQVYMDTIYHKFLYGEIGIEDMERIMKESKQYPNFHKTMLELLELKSMMTGDRKTKIEELENYIDNKYSVTPEEYHDVQKEIADTRERIREDEIIEEYWEQQEVEEENRKLKEQRDYSDSVMERLNKGEITQIEVPNIVKKLESFKDRKNSILLITKLYKEIYGRKEALARLTKYTHISDLTREELETISNMQEELEENNKLEEKKSNEEPSL